MAYQKLSVKDEWNSHFPRPLVNRTDDKCIQREREMGGGERGKIPGGCSGSQVTGMIEVFWGFAIFDSGIFLGRKSCQVFFLVAWVEWDFLGVFKTIWGFVALPAYRGRVVLRISTTKLVKGSEIRHGLFWGSGLVQEFSGFCWKP